jgi:hypothetical protein
MQLVPGVPDVEIPAFAVPEDVVLEALMFPLAGIVPGVALVPDEVVPGTFAPVPPEMLVELAELGAVIVVVVPGKLVLAPDDAPSVPLRPPHGAATVAFGADVAPIEVVVFPLGVVTLPARFVMVPPVATPDAPLGTLTVSVGVVVVPLGRATVPPGLAVVALGVATVPLGVGIVALGIATVPLGAVLPAAPVFVPAVPVPSATWAKAQHAANKIAPVMLTKVRIVEYLLSLLNTCSSVAVIWLPASFSGIDFLLCE